MREIKFRALANGRWWYSDDEAYCLKDFDGVLYLCEDENFYANENEPLLVKIGKALEYTGLKDKNGVDIYEGDIVKTHFKKTEQYSTYDDIGFVTFESPRYTIKDERHGVNNRFYEHSEVIGSIYENKDLLK